MVDIEKLKFDEKGLIPAIVVDAVTKRVLTLAYMNRESLQIGVGMVSRGEVALIVATKGADLGLISTELFGPVIVVVVVTTIITPILLKLVFKDKEEKPSPKPAN